MRRALEKGYERFSSIGQNGWNVIKTGKDLSRQDLTIFYLYHEEVITDAESNRIKKIKSIGRLIDDKITFEGMFRIVLFTGVKRDPDDPRKAEYFFHTQSDGGTTAKSPKQMFMDYEIPNSLDFVRANILAFDEG